MRTTVTLTPAADAHVRRLMRDRGLSFKDAVNAAILAGLGSDSREAFHTPVHDLGRARVGLDDALAVAATLGTTTRPGAGSTRRCRAATRFSSRG